MDKLGGWNSPASTFIYVLLTTAIVYASTLPQTFSRSATTDPRIVLKQHLQASDLGGFTSTQWTVFPGCAQCVCRQDVGLVDCSGKVMSSGRLPGAGSLPRNDVQIFRFDSCGVTHVDYNYFMDFPGIAKISGENNFIREPFVIPSTTSHLYLSQNNLRTTLGFFNTSLSYDLLQYVEFNSNNISVLHSSVFKGFKHLYLLSLTNMDNGIQELEPNCIADLPSLTKVDLSGNNIRYISSDALRNLSSPRASEFFLDVSGNHLTELPEKFVDLPHLTSLMLRDGKLERIHPLAFLMTPRLTFIDLRYNKLTHIENGTFNLSFLFQLLLDANELETISGRAFREGMAIQFFSAIDNKLREIDRSLFTTVTLLIFDVSLNRLTSLPDTLASPYQDYMSKLTAINNQLTVIPAGAFKGMKSLFSINLMGNFISVIKPGAFSSLGRLSELNLIGNTLRTVASNVFQNMRNMEKTDIYLHCDRLSPFPVLPENVKALCVPDSYSIPMIVGCTTALLLLTRGFACRYNYENLVHCTCNRCPNGTIPTGSDGILSHDENLEETGCMPCPAGGWYQDQAGETLCKRCRNGTFVPPHHPRLRANSAANCTVCPTGTDTYRHAGFRACHCLQGYYRLHRFGLCKACNVTSPGLECVDDFATVKRGYWWRLPQSDGSAARYAAFTENMGVYGDSYPRRSVEFNGSLPLVSKCPLPNSCKGGIAGDEMCEEGYTGPLCAVCNSNYSSWFGSCQPCPPLWRSLLQLAGTLLLLFLLMALLYWSDRQQSDKKRAATVMDLVAAKIKIVIGFVQVMSGVIAALLYIPWPAALLVVGSKLKMIGLNVMEAANPSCFSDTLRVSGLMKPIVSFTGQLLAVVFTFSYYQIRYRFLPKLSRKFATDNKLLSRARRSCFRNCWWLLFLSYPSTTAQVMATMPYRPWTCIELCQYEKQVNCEWRLKADMSIVCDYSGSFSPNITWIVCWCIGIYVISLPCLVLWGLLVRHRKQTCSQHEETVHDGPLEPLLVESASREGSVKTELLDSLTFLDENYQSRFWYWELTEILRKFLLTCGVEYYGSSSLSGVAIAALISNIFLLLHAQFKPIKRKSEHWLQLVSLLVVSLNLMMATLIALQQATSTTDSESLHDRTVFSVIVIIVNGFFCLYLIGSLVVAAVRACKSTRSTNGGLKCVRFLVHCVTDGADAEGSTSEDEE